MIAPVPAPISTTDEAAGSTDDAISWESSGELGVSDPIALGFSRSERKKRKGAGSVKLMALPGGYPSGYRWDPRLVKHKGDAVQDASRTLSIASAQRYASIANLSCAISSVCLSGRAAKTAVAAGR